LPEIKIKMEYKIVSGVMVEELERRVQALIEDGWDPIGGMVLSPDGTTFYQTMILEDYDDDDEDYDE
jgi:hypothetical protein